MPKPKFDPNAAFKNIVGAAEQAEQESNILEDTLSNAISNISYNRKNNILDNIKTERDAGATHSFYLTDKTYNALVKISKEKKISISKFLEGILRQVLFMGE